MRTEHTEKQVCMQQTKFMRTSATHNHMPACEKHTDTHCDVSHGFVCVCDSLSPSHSADALLCIGICSYACIVEHDGFVCGVFCIYFFYPQFDSNNFLSKRIHKHALRARACSCNVN